MNRRPMAVSSTLLPVPGPLILVLLVLGLLVLESGVATAQNKQSIILATEEWAPFRMADGDSPKGYKGIDIDLVLLLEEKLGIEIIVQRHPWARALELLKGGQVDFVTGIAYTPERAVYAEFVPTPYFGVQPVFYTQSGKGALVKGYQDLRGKTIGQSISSAYFEPYNNDTSLTKISVATEVQIIQMLALGRIDLGIGTNPNLAWDIRTQNLQTKLEPTMYQPRDRTELYLAFSKKSVHRTLGPRIDGIIQGLLKDGTLERIAGKYR